MKLLNKVALVTGSSRGIGKEIAIDLAKNGCNVVINCKSGITSANKVLEEIKSYNVKGMVVCCDIACENEAIDLINKVVSEFGKIDILVNNAGIALDTTFEDKTADMFRQTLDVNLIAPFVLSKEASKYMLENKYGKIINISSTNGIDTYYPYSIDYDASKAGLINMTHNLAEQFKPYINVNCVCPGWVNTEMNKELDKDFINEEISKIKLGRFANPKEIAKVVTFLASDDASYVNDAIIRVDGGEK